MCTTIHVLEILWKRFRAWKAQHFNVLECECELECKPWSLFSEPILNDLIVYDFFSALLVLSCFAIYTQQWCIAEILCTCTSLYSTIIQVILAKWLINVVPASVYSYRPANSFFAAVYMHAYNMTLCYLEIPEELRRQYFRENNVTNVKQKDLLELLLYLSRTKWAVTGWFSSLYSKVRTTRTSWWAF